jgi:hypothetical protein
VLWCRVNRRRRTGTVVSALHQNSWIQDILGSLTVTVLMQYLCLREQLQDITLDKNTPDKFEWCWCPSGHYSLRSAYLDMFHGQSVVLGAKELWKAPIEFQLFKWLTKLDLTCICFQKILTHCCFKFSSSIYSN